MTLCLGKGDNKGDNYEEYTIVQRRQRFNGDVADGDRQKCIGRRDRCI